MKNNILVYLITLFSILSSGSVLGFMFGNTFLDIINIILICFYIVLCSRKIRCPKKVGSVVVALGFLLGVECFVYPQGVAYFLRFCGLLLVGIFFFWYLENNQISIALIYEQILRLMCVVNLFFWLMAGVLKLIQPSSIVSIDMFTGYRNFYNLYFEMPNIELSFFGILTVPRNSGVFWEPGVWQTYVNLALLIYLFRVEKKNKYIIMMYMMVVVSTFSTTGIIVLLAIVVYYGYSNSRGMNKLIVTLLLLILAVVVGAEVLEDKFTNYAASYDYRVSDFTNSLRIFADNIVFGSGYGNTDVFREYSAYTSARGNSNGLMAWVSQMGICGVLLVAIPFSGLIRKQREQKNMMLFLLFLYIVLNFSEPLFEFGMNVFILSLLYVKYFMLRKKGMLEDKSDGY